MKSKAKDIQLWCDEHLSPLAWKRVILRNLTVVTENGLELEEIENPSNELMLPEKIVKTMLSTIEELYDVTVPFSAITVES